MRADDYPVPLSDPEAEGLPGTADDDSTAKDDVATGREADGPEPAALPSDEPQAVDRFGNTAQEQLDGESVDYKLSREQFERQVDDPLAGPVDPGIAAEADSDEAAAQAQLDADVIDPGPTSNPASAVSIYDHDKLGGRTSRPVGRLVDPDEGARDDDETDSIAADAGAAGGGPSAEELAIHETEPPTERTGY
jgi:hypothetical protein